MTDVQTYVSDAPKSRQRARKSACDNAFLPPDHTQQFDALGRRKKPREDDDGQVKYRPTHQIAGHRLKSLLVERALEREAVDAAMVATLNIGSRPDRLVAPLNAIYETVLEYFKATAITLTELRDTRNHRLGLISYVRAIVIEIAARHSRYSPNRFAEKFGCDHSSVSFARQKVRNILSFNDIEARALRADLNAITLALANRFDWSSVAPQDSRLELAHRLGHHVEKIKLWLSMYGGNPCFPADHKQITDDIAEASDILKRDSWS